jgi:hypothetical protein
MDLIALCRETYRILAGQVPDPRIPVANQLDSIPLGVLSLTRLTRAADMVRNQGLKCFFTTVLGSFHDRTMDLVRITDDLIDMDALAAFIWRSAPDYQCTNVTWTSRPGRRYDWLVSTNDGSGTRARPLNDRGISGADIMRHLLNDSRIPSRRRYKAFQWMKKTLGLVMPSPRVTWFSSQANDRFGYLISCASSWRITGAGTHRVYSKLLKKYFNVVTGITGLKIRRVVNMADPNMGPEVVDLLTRPAVENGERREVRLFGQATHENTRPQRIVRNTIASTIFQNGWSAVSPVPQAYTSWVPIEFARRCEVTNTYVYHNPSKGVHATPVVVFIGGRFVLTYKELWGGACVTEEPHATNPWHLVRNPYASGEGIHYHNPYMSRMASRPSGVPFGGRGIGSAMHPSARIATLLVSTGNETSPRGPQLVTFHVGSNIPTMESLLSHPTYYATVTPASVDPYGWMSDRGLRMAPEAMTATAQHSVIIGAMRDADPTPPLDARSISGPTPPEPDDDDDDDDDDSDSDSDSDSDDDSGSDSSRFPWLDRAGRPNRRAPATPPEFITVGRYHHHGGGTSLFRQPLGSANYTIGFELECGVHRSPHPQGGDSLVEATGEGHRIATPPGWGNDPNYGRGLFNRVEQDRSCGIDPRTGGRRPGVELVSNILPLGMAVIGQVRDLVEENKDWINNNITSRNCGGHMTVGTTVLSGQNLWNRIRSYSGLVYALFKRRLLVNYTFNNKRLNYDDRDIRYAAIRARGERGNRVEFRLVSRFKSTKDLMWKYEVFARIADALREDITFNDFLTEVRPTLLARYKTPEKVDIVIRFAKHFQLYLNTGVVHVSIHRYIDGPAVGWSVNH